MTFDDHLMRAIERKLAPTMRDCLFNADQISMSEICPHVVVPMTAQATAVRNAGLHEVAIDCTVIPKAGTGDLISARVVYSERMPGTGSDKAALVAHVLDGLRDHLFGVIAREEAERLLAKKSEANE